MSQENEMQTVFEQESWGDDGHIGLRILLLYTRELTRDDKITINRAARDILQELHVSTCLNDPARQAKKQDMILAIRGCFVDAGWAPIYMEEMPNQYCGPRCCPHVPWLSVTTQAGHFVLGWRKHVIELRWGDTQITTPSEEVFAKEKVTRGAHMIHAWDYEKLTEYLRVLHADFVQKSGG